MRQESREAAMFDLKKWDSSENIFFNTGIIWIALCFGFWLLWSIYLFSGGTFSLLSVSWENDFLGFLFVSVPGLSAIETSYAIRITKKKLKRSGILVVTVILFGLLTYLQFKFINILTVYVN